MPITQGAGNPDWTRDETILALDLLARHGGRPVDRRHVDVGELSDLLRAAVLHPQDGRKDNFRNDDGVALKLQNLLSAIEPTRGLSASKLDHEIVSEFPPERYAELSELAQLLRSKIAAPEADEPLPSDEVFAEGRVLTRRHRFRDARLREQLLRKLKDKPLVCEMCGPMQLPTDRTFAEAQFEAHHRVPLAQAEGEVKTRVADMALLCACCHRLIHRMISREKRWVDVPEAARMRAELLA